jgi:hypothetical protein
MHTHMYRCLKPRRMKESNNPHLAMSIGGGHIVDGRVYDTVVSVAHQYPGTKYIYIYTCIYIYIYI